MSQTTRERKELDPRYQWKLERIYADDEAWERAFGTIEDRLPELEAYRGRLAENAATLLAFLDLMTEVGREVEKLHNYAHMRHDGDARVTRYQALEGRSQGLHARLEQTLSFLNPEILALEPEVLGTWLAATPGLAPYRFSLLDIQRARPHTLSQQEERIAAMAAELTMAPGNIYNVAHDADQSFEPLVDEQGTEHEVSHARYTVALRHPDRTLRERWLRRYLASFGRIRNTLTYTLSAQVKAHQFHQEVHRYPSCLEASLFSAAIPAEVFHGLIRTVGANLEPLHRFVHLRRELLSLSDGVHWHDLYAPLSQRPEARFPYDQARGHLVAALGVLGQEYVAALEVALSPEEGWIDVFPNKGKRSGAYSSGCYDTVPYILLNYQDEFEDLCTLAHELGHSLHSYFSNKAQHYVNAGYDIFCAEVASTLDETLLVNHLIDHTSDPGEKLSYLDSYLSNIVKTLYFQTMYSEFELAVHERAEAGEALDHEYLDDLWGRGLTKYFGPDFVLDDDVKMGWMRIPHFYYDFYVFKYATSISAAHDLFALLEHDQAATRGKILGFLSAGGSDHPIAILKAAGVDMTTPRPVENTVARFSRLLGEFERLTADDRKRA
ncbi:MAG: oligoendopeptidase F [Deltaproteobacteria bacterium RIFOXYA12_FULL_61_11]|nr:MAG: oligoendopeptidase F [Deltaproteobacteria bacterium RIFOXYA12_FULL_61_11]